MAKLHVIGTGLNLPRVQVKMENSLFAKVVTSEERNRGLWAPLNIPLFELEFVPSMKRQGSSTWAKSVEKEVFHLMESF